MKTRERILKTSLQVFNRSGVASTTTNHIAESLGISPGNLYYHFKNKEEILRELFRRMAAQVEGVIAENVNQAGSPETFFREVFGIFWAFRFFHREMYHLRRKDRSLAQIWKQHITTVSEGITATVKAWEGGGFLRPLTERERSTITTNFMVSASSFLHFYESIERNVSKQAIAQGVRHSLDVLTPYMTNEYCNVVSSKKSKDSGVPTS